jgi:peptide/nickel transport system substrate-binding protein
MKWRIGGLKMKYLLIPGVIVLICAFIITGCSATSTTPATSPAAAPATKVAAPTTAAAPVTTAPTALATTAKPTAAATTATPISGGTITYIDPTTVGGPLGLPWLNRQNYNGFQLCLECLVDSDKDGTMVPRLAESWDLSASPNPSITFHLRKGVKFHDGTDFNAQVLVWNLKKYAEGGYFVASRYTKSYDIIDDYTLRLNLTEWRTTLLGAFNMAPLVSQAAFEKNGEDWARWNMVGTGPFKQSAFNRDVSLTAVKFDNYWQKGKPYLDQVQYVNVVDELTRLATLRSGKGEICDLNKSGKAAIALKNDGYQIYTQSSGALALIPDSVNAASPWSNIKVRQAAEYAIDKDAIAKAFGYGFTSAAYQWYPEGAWAYNPAIVQRKYDPAKAKQLMTEAGYPNGFKSVIISDNTANKDIATAVKSYLDTVGITVELDFPAAARFTDYSQGKWDNALLFTTMRAGAQPTQGMSFTSEPRTQYKSNKNPDGWMTLYNKMNTTLTLEQQNVWASFKAMSDDVMLIPIMYAYDMIEVSPKLQEHSFGKLANAVTWNVSGAWLSK